MTIAYLANNIAPTGVPAVPLSIRQFNAAEVELQRAAAEIHWRSSKIATIQEVGALLVAFAGMTSALLHRAQNEVAIAGLLWFFISAWALGHFARKFAEDAACVQEVFDCRLFYLEWNSTLAPESCISRDQVIDLASRVKLGSEVDKRITKGWYDPTHGLQYPYDVLCTQEQNLLWDLRLRKRFRRILTVLGVTWTTIGFLIALSGAPMAKTLLVIFVPAAAAYDLGRERWRTQRDVVRERGRLAELVGKALTDGRPGPLTTRRRTDLQLLARRIQDGIFRTRCEFGRVPGLIYLRHRERDEVQLAQVLEAHRMRLTA